MTKLAFRVNGWPVMYDDKKFYYHIVGCGFPYNERKFNTPQSCVFWMSKHNKFKKKKDSK